MKKFYALMLVLTMGLAVLTGCGSDAVADELVNFLNNDIKEIKDNFNTMGEQINKMPEVTDVDELVKMIKDDMLPLANSSIDTLEKIELKTNEVKGLRDKMKSAFEKYKESFETLASAYENSDEDAMGDAEEKMNEAKSLMEEYKSSMESIAKEHDVEITN